MTISITSLYSNDIEYIKMVSEEGAIIYYTLDETEPTNESNLYTDKIPYPVNKTIKAKSYKEGQYSDTFIYECCIPLSNYVYSEIRQSKHNKIIIDRELDLCGSYSTTFISDIYISNTGKLKSGMINLENKYYIYPMGIDEVTKLDNIQLINIPDGQIIFNSEKNTYKIRRNNKWITLPIGISGTFSNKPELSINDIGYSYYCTDRQTTEGARNGIMIYYAWVDTWVDALGRVVV